MSAKQRTAERKLRGFGEVAARREGRVPSRALGPLGHERPEPIAGSAQQRIEALAAHAGLVLVEQRVVEVVAELERLGALADERQQQRERFRERREVVRAARVLPRGEAVRAAFRKCGDETRGQRDCRSAQAREPVQLRALPRVALAARRHRVHEIAEPGVASSSCRTLSTTPSCDARESAAPAGR